MMNGKRAFTLVELLVVVGIIALLVTILMPSLSRAMDLAKSSICLSNMRSIMMAKMVYASMNQERLPFMGESDWAADPDGYVDQYPQGQFDLIWFEQGYEDNEVSIWADLLVWEDLIGVDAFVCPGERAPRGEKCIELGRHQNNYIVNKHLYHGLKGFAWKCIEAPCLRDIANPAEKVGVTGVHGGAEVAIYMELSQYGWSCEGLIAHLNYSGSYGFLDGHAENLTWKEVFGKPYDPDVGLGQNILDCGADWYSPDYDPPKMFLPYE